MSTTRTPPGTAALHPSSSGNEAPATNVRRRGKSPTRVSLRGEGVRGRGSDRGTQHHQPATATATATQWTPALTRTFLEAIVNEFEANGQETGGWGHSAWISVQDEIWDNTGEFVDKKELVKKYEILKSEWRAWVLIKEDKSVIGTGYNPKTGLVEGPGYWWDIMIARNPKVAKFRDNFLEHEELMGLVYEKVTATESEANSAGDSDSNHDIAKGSEESDEMNSDGTGPATKNTFVPLLCKGKVQSDPNLSTLCGLSSKKRKAPESSELSASLAELIEDVKNNKSRVLQVRKGQWGVSDAIEKLTNLPLFNDNQQRNPPLFKDNNVKTEFFNWCIQLFRRSDKDVDIFCSLATVDQRTAWILSEQQRASDAFQAEQTRGLCPIGAWGLVTNHQPQPSYSRTPDTWRWTDNNPTQTAGQYAPYELGSSNWNSGPISHVTTRVTNPIHTEEKSSSDSEVEVDDEICAQVVMEQELELISFSFTGSQDMHPKKTTKDTIPYGSPNWS